MAFKSIVVKVGNDGNQHFSFYNYVFVSKKNSNIREPHLNYRLQLRDTSKIFLFCKEK